MKKYRKGGKSATKHDFVFMKPITGNDGTLYFEADDGTVYNADGSLAAPITANVYPSYGVLNTYPISKSYPITHSSLWMKTNDPNSNYGYINVDKSSYSDDYNVLTNNCADATDRVISELVGRKADKTLGVTTPLDTMQNLFFNYPNVQRKSISGGIDTLFTMSRQEYENLVDKLKKKYPKNAHEGGRYSPEYSDF